MSGLYGEAQVRAARTELSRAEAGIGYAGARKTPLTPAMSPESIEHAADLVEQADALIVAAGAGMVVDSGLPDFRGNAGFWKAYPALGKQRLNFTEVASPRTFETGPALAWGFYGHRLDLYWRTVPHDGFAVLRRWSDQMPLGSFVFTSNVDGQFQRAGFPEGLVYECHGSIHWLQCLRPCSDDIWRADELSPRVDNDTSRWRGPLPRCPRCGGLARPNILMFGDGGWLEERADQQRARLDAWLARARRPVVVELGAGTYVASVRYFSQQVIHEHGGRLVRINPRESEVPTPMDIGLPAGAPQGLTAIDEVLKER
jgi:NAD-dependent SIR2 family protein deacetylase